MENSDPRSGIKHPVFATLPPVYRLHFLIGVLFNVGCGVVRVRSSSVGSASACCKAGPNSILGSEPQEASLAERRSDEDTRRIRVSANDEG
jgi:hypothetical protein